MTTDIVQISKFLSYVLRHRPDEIGLTLDTEGWADLHALIAGAATKGMDLTPDVIRHVVATNAKQRFALSADDLRIRAVQGHSTDSVQLQFAEQVPPDTLYHGTALRFLDAIREQGLVPGSRHHVHLSPDRQTALEVGRRHGKPAVLEIQARAMHELGYRFFRAENGVWLTEAVPPAHIGE